MRLSFLAPIAAAAALASASTVNAAIPIYPNPGVQAPAVPTYVAPFAGDVTAWFLLRNAAFVSEVGVGINGALPTAWFLNNGTASPGDSAVLGTVAAGDVIRFYLRVVTTGNIFSTDPADPLANNGGINHAWHTPYAGGDFGVPPSLLIGFEDILGGGDLDYDDHVFSFRFPGAPGVIPEPATWAMLITGFGLVGFALRRRKQAAIA